MSHVHIKNITATDTIRRNDGDTIVNNSATDNMIAIQNSAGNSYMIFTDDESTLETYLNNATLV